MEDLVEKIRDMYNNDKSHGFIIHLIHAYLPAQVKTSKIFDKGNFTCCITHDKLLTLEDTMELVQSIPMQQVIQGMLNPEIQSKNLEEMKTKQGSRKVGFIGEKTDKYLSFDALEALQSFVIQEILQGNREINGITNKMRRKECF